MRIDTNKSRSNVLLVSFLCLFVSFRILVYESAKRHEKARKDTRKDGKRHAKTPQET